MQWNHQEFIKNKKSNITVRNLNSAVSGKSLTWRVLGMLPAFKNKPTLGQSDAWHAQRSLRLHHACMKHVVDSVNRFCSADTRLAWHCLPGLLRRARHSGPASSTRQRCWRPWRAGTRRRWVGHQACMHETRSGSEDTHMLAWWTGDTHEIYRSYTMYKLVFQTLYVLSKLDPKGWTASVVYTWYILGVTLSYLWHMTYCTWCATEMAARYKHWDALNGSPSCTGA